MKRFCILILLAVTAATALSGQEIDLQMAVATQALNETMLQRLNVPQEDIDEILALQTQFQRLREETNIEMNVIKAQLAQQLYHPDASQREVEKLLERAAELRLEQEKAQARNYMQVRAHLGEENWEKLMQQIRIQVRKRQQAQADADAPQARVGNTGQAGTAAGAAGSTGKR